MRNEFPSESSMSPAWDHRALVNLRIELHSSPVEFLHLMAEEEHHPAFDPIEVRNLLRKERDMGHEPELLILGCMEMASFHHFISRGFGEESGARMRRTFFSSEFWWLQTRFRPAWNSSWMRSFHRPGQMVGMRRSRTRSIVISVGRW